MACAMRFPKILDDREAGDTTGGCMDGAESGPCDLLHAQAMGDASPAWCLEWSGVAACLGCGLEVTCCFFVC